MNMVDVLHEMGHIAGLRHEFARPDALKHMYRQESSTGVKALGQFDYRSIMQYPFKCGTDTQDKSWKILKNEEY